MDSLTELVEGNLKQQYDMAKDQSKAVINAIATIQMKEQME